MLAAAIPVGEACRYARCMGGIWFKTREFGGILSESAGYRSGLTLSEAQLRELLDEGNFGDLWPTEDGTMRIRSEEFEELHWYLLHRLVARRRATSPFRSAPSGTALRMIRRAPLSSNQ